MPTVLSNGALRNGSLMLTSPAALFAAGEVGVWYDPSDMYTLFQDAAGTTPVTAVEQPVGLMLDKSKGAVGTNGVKRVNLLSYSEQFDNSVWEKTETNATISAFGSGSVANTTATTDPLGGNTADFIVPTTTTSSHRTRQLITFTGVATFSFYAKAGGYDYCYATNSPNNWVYFDLTNGSMSTLGTGWGSASCTSVGNGWYRCSVTNSSSQSWVYAAIGVAAAWQSSGNTGAAAYAGNGTSGIYVWGAQLEAASSASTYQRITADWPSTMAGNHATQSTSASRPVLSARYNLLVGTDTLATQSVTTVATTYTLSFSGAGSITLSGTKTGTYSAGTNSLTGVTAGTLTLTVSGTVTGADLRVSNDGVGLPAYQRVNTSTDYDVAGFPYYLKFDGTDDSLATGSINFTSTDEMTLCAGVRKLSDAAVTILAELSSVIDSNSGSFTVAAPLDTSTQRYGAVSRGSAALAIETQRSIVTGVGSAPDSAVITFTGDISGDRTVIRRNGTAFTAGTGDQGSGNYGNYALNIGSRAGSSLRYNGRLYSMIVRGASSSTGEIADTEGWVNSRVRAY